MTKKSASLGTKLIDILTNKEANQESFAIKSQNDEAFISVKQEILAVEKEINSNAKRIQELYTASPFSLSKIYAAECEGELLQRKLNWLNEKSDELF